MTLVVDYSSTQRTLDLGDCIRHFEIREVFPVGAAERAPLFVSDGHCTDAGYALMARTVAAEIAVVLGD